MWGWTGGRLPQGAPVLADDATLAAWAGSRADHPPSTPAGLTGGLLWRALGGAGAVGRFDTDQAMHFPIDLGKVWLDDLETAGQPRWFANSVLARSRLWTRGAVVLNGPLFAGMRRARPLHFGVRAHPNDGLLDCYEWELSLGEVRRVGRRAGNGQHLPHPGIREQRRAQVDIDLGRPSSVWIDGEHAGRAQRLVARVVADAAVVVL